QQKQNSASLDYLKQLELLKDHETIAHLANGIQRFTLPDEFAFVLLYQKLATEYRNVPACNELAQIYLNRRQLEKALSWCNMGLKLVDENNNWLKKKLQELKHQITGTFGEFKFDNRPLVFGSPTIIPFEYRNAKSVALTLQPVDSEKMMALYEKNIMDSESGLQDSSRLESFFAEKSVYRKFLLPAVKKWNEKLPAGRKYYSHQSDLKIVFPKPGIYLLTAEMAGGVISRIPVVCENIKIITKGLQNNELLWQVFQAKNGQPIAHQKLNFFFYRANWDSKTRKQTLSHYQFSAVTDSNGAIMEDREQRFPKEFSYGGYWLCTGKYADGAFFCCASHSYFSGSNSVLEGTRSHSKAILITDRPVYRPGQKVQLKFWGQQVTYLPDVKNPFQNQVLNIVVLDPRQQQIWPPSKDKISSSTVDAKMDEYGGWNGEFTLGEDAALGTYSVVEKGMTVGSFRVEEYRKPEYEVTIDTPAKVPSLGEKIPITVQAKYYFGEPVKDGDVIVKILRYDYQDAYWPIGPWNWLYGDGYCWLAEDYCWYPHWRSWGWKRPWFPGGRRYYGGRPEVVLNMHATLDEQGEAQILLDTAMTKKFLGDRDHRYEITAEVRNKAQRTIMSQKEIVVSRKPFQVMAWTRGGYYRTGQEIQACVRSVSSNNESLKTTGRLQIYRIEYFKEKAPKETLREEFAVQTDEDGFFEQHFQIAESGQYRLAWTMKNGKDLVTGACIIGVYGKKIKDQNFQYNDLELVPDKAVYQPGETMHLRVNTAAKNSMVLLFIRPINGACPRPKYLQLDGKSLEVDIPVKGIDYPNFYVEAGTMRDGVWHHAVREIAVPPQKRKLNLELQLSETKTTPGAPASVTVCVTDSQGKPFQGSLVMTVYDKSLEYISGGSNVPDILSHFWKWKNNYQNRTGCPHWYSSLLRFEKDPANMRELGIFDGTLQRLLGVGAMDSSNVCCESKLDADGMLGGMRLAGSAGPLPTIAASFKMMKKEKNRTSDSDKGVAKQEQNKTGVVLRTNFADTACWRGNLETDAFGKAVIPFTLPDSLTTWKVRAW
ncbi:MAG: MG2 domain-containing protein, partial [Lentisphaeria bacterium]